MIIKKIITVICFAFSFPYLFCNIHFLSNITSATLFAHLLSSEAKAELLSTENPTSLKSKAPLHENSTIKGRAQRETLSYEQEKKELLADKFHTYLSNKVLATADWLDSFFDDPRFEKIENRSRVKLRFDTFHDDDLGTEFKVRINAKITLPRFEKKAKLIITNDPDEDRGGGRLTGSTATERFSSDEEQNLTTSIQYFLREADRLNLSLRTGIRFRDDSPQLFAGPRYRRLFEFDWVDLRITEEVLWWTDQGWESRTLLDIERQFKNDLFIRLTADGYWTEEIDGYSYSLGAKLLQPLSLNRVLEYEWNNFFKTRPFHELTETQLRIRYRQKIWREWLFMEIAPQVRFPRGADFDFTPGILVRFEFILGRYELQKV